MENKIFFHNVYFWLKQPENNKDCEAFEVALQKFLNASIYTRTAFITKPAHTDREVVDNSYTYCLLVSFENKEQHNLYQKEPAHALFLKEASNLWGKVQVYDSEEI
ncbi:Dabb family protein [Wenyingzhuangia sp. 2_MG-2023]|uniref:Dabb family protein n=1 Tax=Wenyingzhuangia sp. 2_MG-2023 TaxID=3062639 RepID=UPI0026E11C8C|nr:Dabb family protein [Wenyingzhuangia sp. 2_MG-2023]MDO6737717.1 Dabb family protein [Wenyingzhuangia sp. 2_MG-2023]